jgi:nucleotidyltransferase substrate binding protein (TIGR01987 family)
MPLELDGLRKALLSLEEAIKRTSDPALLSTQDEFGVCMFKAAVIQYFEISYELCWKLIQRWLSANVPGDESALPRTRKDLFRIAARHGLIQAPEHWFGYAEARNRTSHIYSAEISQAVYELAISFLPEGKVLLRNLDKTNG